MSIALYRTRADILDEMLSQLQGAIPDVYVGEDGILYIKFAVEAGQLENGFMANQMLLQDMFIQTASFSALRQHGEQYNVFVKEGTRSLGSLRFEGSGGTYVPMGTEVGYDPGNGLDVVYFTSTLDGTIPNPGEPSAPVAAQGAAGGLSGTYEYVMTYLTAAGETMPSPVSNAVTPSAQQVNLTGLSIGGPGTTGRRIYRDKGGAGDYRMVVELDNIVTTYADNISDVVVASHSADPTSDTAHRIIVSGEALDDGVEGNVVIGAINILTDAPAEITGVYNTTAFIGGTDTEDTEEFRRRLLQFIQNPQTGSPDDLKSWAENIGGVETATIFPNDNMGTATPGHVTVRVTGPAGAIPPQAVLDAVYADLLSRDLANISLHVTTFTPVTTTVTVDVTTTPIYALGDVSASVQAAVADYINGLQAGETFYASGVIAAVKPITGVADVAVTSPVGNLTTQPTEKRVAGVVTVV